MFSNNSWLMESIHEVFRQSFYYFIVFPTNKQTFRIFAKTVFVYWPKGLCVLIYIINFIVVMFNIIILLYLFIYFALQCLIQATGHK